MPRLPAITHHQPLAEQEVKKSWSPAKRQGGSAATLSTRGMTTAISQHVTASLLRSCCRRH